MTYLFRFWEEHENACRLPAFFAKKLKKNQHKSLAAFLAADRTTVQNLKPTLYAGCVHKKAASCTRCGFRCAKEF